MHGACPTAAADLGRHADRRGFDGVPMQRAEHRIAPPDNVQGTIQKIHVEADVPPCTWLSGATGGQSPLRHGNSMLEGLGKGCSMSSRI